NSTKELSSRTVSSRDEGNTIPPSAAGLGVEVPPFWKTPTLPRIGLGRLISSCSFCTPGSTAEAVEPARRLVGPPPSPAIDVEAPADLNATWGATRTPARKLPGPPAGVPLISNVFPVIFHSLDWPLANIPTPKGCALGLKLGFAIAAAKGAKSNSQSSTIRPEQFTARTPIATTRLFTIETTSGSKLLTGMPAKWPAAGEKGDAGGRNLMPRSDTLFTLSNTTSPSPNWLSSVGCA